MAKSIIRKLDRAIQRINGEIAIKTDQDNLYSRGLSREGYHGGYADALSDVRLMLNGTTPCRRPEYWEDESWIDGQADNQKESEKIKERAESIYTFYLRKIKPDRKTKGRAISNILKHFKRFSVDDLKSAVLNYMSQAIYYKPQFRKDPANFFGVNEPYFKDFIPKELNDEEELENSDNVSLIPPVLTQEYLNKINN